MENLGIDIKLLVAQLTNFLLFYFIFKKFIAKPFANFLKSEKQKDEVKEQLDQKIKELGEKEKIVEQQMKEKLEKEKEKLVKQAKEQAEKIKKETIQKAEEEASKIKSKALDEMEKEKKMFEAKLRKEIIEISVELVEKGLKNYLSENTRKEVTNSIIKNSQKAN